MTEIIKARNITVDIRKKQILNGISINVEKGKIYSIIGPNGSGKTTLLRVISRNLKPAQGDVLLNGQNVHRMNTKKTAKTMAVLTQVHSGMNDVTVRQLISYGRFAHRDWWKAKDSKDTDIIDDCIEKTGLERFSERKISTLSGGERQRAWIAMSLAQKPQILILDEPTTFLDISHQLEVLELVARLNKDENITILMVLHDINHAARYSDELIVIKDGKVYANGVPSQVLTPAIFREVFNVEADISQNGQSSKPYFYAKCVLKEEK
jgi:iron complex transport system ATP-binding protein